MKPTQRLRSPKTVLVACLLMVALAASACGSGDRQGVDTQPADADVLITPETSGPAQQPNGTEDTSLAWNRVGPTMPTTPSLTPIPALGDLGLGTDTSTLPSPSPFAAQNGESETSATTRTSSQRSTNETAARNQVNSNAGQNQAVQSPSGDGFASGSAVGGNVQAVSGGGSLVPDAAPSTLTGGSGPARAAVMIKVPNDKTARNSLHGIEYADIIFEELVEGGVTRFAAVFHSQLPERVQPVRSVRGPDPELVLSVGGVFAYSGGAGPFIARINAIPIVAVNETSAGGAMYRVAGKAPYNLAANAAALANLSGEPARSPFAFGPLTATGGSATNVTVRISRAQTTNFRWEGSAGRYLRFNAGNPEVTQSGAQVSFSNVVVLGVATAGTGVIDTAGSESPNSITVGQGSAWVFRDGQVIPGTWSRLDGTSPWALTDTAGNPIRLAPGRTMVELMPVAGPYASGSIAWG
ncbi:MAG: DUF3048 domain-containing protein [Acidimicrobiia bacterium]|nr:DUF3048 domain-containing protein [Acidimicrobiia bacterium]